MREVADGRGEGVSAAGGAVKRSRTTFQMPIRDSCAHFGPKRVPSERRTDMAARPLERKTTAMALREGKGRAMSDTI